jgi:hypothetical protein
MTGFITQDLRGERESLLEAERVEREARIEAEVTNFCSAENLRAIVEEARSEVSAIYLKTGRVKDVSLYKPVITKAVSERHSCRQALLEALQEAEPQTTSVNFEHKSHPKADEQPYYIWIQFQEGLT